MNPQQEYYLRNKVLAPYFFYGSSKVLLNNFARMMSCDKYKLVEINAINKEGHDSANIGRFDISVFVPQKGGSFFSRVNYWTTYWSEYSDNLTRQVSEWRASGWRAVTDPKVLKLISWELLSYCMDAKFAELPVFILDLNYKLLDYNIPYEGRVDLIDSVINHINIQAESTDKYSYRSILSAWSNISDLVNTSPHGHWLAELVNR